MVFRELFFFTIGEDFLIIYIYIPKNEYTLFLMETLSM